MFRDVSSPFRETAGNIEFSSFSIHLFSIPSESLLSRTYTVLIDVTSFSNIGR